LGLVTVATSVTHAAPVRNDAIAVPDVFVREVVVAVPDDDGQPTVVQYHPNVLKRCFEWR
jgi:hypothetical protein